MVDNQYARRKQTREAKNLCTRCGARPRYVGYKMCRECLSQKAERRAAVRAERKCLNCGAKLAETDGVRCPSCAKRRNLARSLARGSDPLRQKKKVGEQYGVSLEELATWDEMCRTGTCDICGLSADSCLYGKLSRDHAHTEKPFPRGCLCTRCNNLLGAFEEVLSRGGMRPLDPANPFCQYLISRDYRYRSTDA